jgi:hypothetical protein
MRVCVLLLAFVLAACIPWNGCPGPPPSAAEWVGVWTSTGGSGAGTRITFHEDGLVEVVNAPYAYFASLSDDEILAATSGGRGPDETERISIRGTWSVQDASEIAHPQDWAESWRIGADFEAQPGLPRGLGAEFMYSRERGVPVIRIFFNDPDLAIYIYLDKTSSTPKKGPPSTDAP